MKIVNPIAKRGEDIACKFLINRGYKVIERNFRQRNGEIDIVAIDQADKNDHVLAFVEVKTRTSEKFGTPLEAINNWKLRSLINVAQYYKIIHPKLPEHLRIDAVSVKLTSNGDIEDVKLIKNISGF